MMINSRSKKYSVVGIMSGTSLDGADIAGCEFENIDNKWRFRIVVCSTIPYPAAWKLRLSGAQNLCGEDLAMLNVEYGKFIGHLVYHFIQQHNFRPDLIASHGHTVFHRPEAGLTLQIGSGAEIAAKTGITVVCDFRSQDVALGGQGAPLVPIGDQLLFASFDACMNIGGFSNISFDENGARRAFDICPANFVLNKLAQAEGYEFDENGTLSASGKLHQELLSALNAIEFYRQPAPKSLGREWMEKVFFPVLEKFDMPVRDQLRTVVEHIAMQISKQTQNPGKLLVTGGGAKNNFLMERISAHSNQTIIFPDPEIVDFKEALVFAFLGLLRMLNLPNCLASVTGATRDHSSGAVFYGSKH
jgi:anhydro-N-acetylmuramic acid kinase